MGKSYFIRHKILDCYTIILVQGKLFPTLLALFATKIFKSLNLISPLEEGRTGRKQNTLMPRGETLLQIEALG